MKMVRSLAKAGEIAKDVPVMPSGPMARQSVPMLPGGEAPGKDWASLQATRVNPMMMTAAMSQYRLT